MKIHIDASKAIRQANAAHKSLSKQTRAKAIAHALNVTARKARVASNREIRQLYKIRSKDINKGIRTTPAHYKSSSIEAAVIATGRPLPIIAFRPSVSKRGVSVNIMGKRKRFAHAFKATMRSGHTGIFVRGQYKSGKLVSRKRRAMRSPLNDTPITEVLTVGVPTAFGNDVVMRHLMKKIEDELPRELSRAFNYFSGGTQGGGVSSLF